MGAVRLFGVLIVNVPSNHSGITFPAPNDSLLPVQCRRRSRGIEGKIIAREDLCPYELSTDRFEGPGV